MKHLNKITVFLLVFSMLITFASCGGNVSDASETTTQSAETTTHTAIESVNLKASKTDFNVLAEVVRGIWLSSPVIIPESSSGDYFHDCSSDTALANAMYMIQNHGSSLFSEADALYGLGIESECFLGYNYETEEPQTIPTDPMNAFGGKEYIRIDADGVDWVLENILNVSPDRTETDDDFDTSEYYGVFNYYYYDGCYYYEIQEGGGGGHTPTVQDYAQQEDGSYIVTLNTGEEGSDDDYSVLEASAALKEIDGERVWSVSYLKVVSVVN